MASSKLVAFGRLSSGHRNVMFNVTHNWSKLCMQGLYEPTTVTASKRHFYSVKRIDLAPISSSHFKFLTVKNYYFYPQQRLQNTLHSEDKRKDSLPKSDSTSKSQGGQEEEDDLEKFNKLSMFKKFQAMYRDYWYILIPVHLVTSAMFFGSFYYAASSGVDIVALLESLHVSERWINPLRDSSVGYIAIAYLLYKILTPIRYTVTLGGTTFAIRYLKARNLIKPRPFPIKDPFKEISKALRAMRLPENERKKYLEDQNVSRFGKAVCRALTAWRNKSDNISKPKK